jgi:hypothetical protein
MVSSPVFIHSLFRTGSTYLFHVFRRREADFWCYQEPLHELSFYSKSDKSLLLSDREEKMAQLRHPKIGRPYFFELYEVADECLGFLSAEAIYDGYFAMDHSDIGIPFWHALILAAPARPVIQECRTSGRMGAIKSQLGGFHLYLWRNPWDQWWSYKVDRYFDVTNQLFINSPRHPEVIRLLRQAIGFQSLNHGDIESRKQWFMKHPLSPEHSYLVFYVLWLMGLHHGRMHADGLLSIDRLGDSHAYRHEIAHFLDENGISALDFSDCSIPQATYSSADRKFFDGIEEKAHALFLASGMSQEEMDRLQAIRQEYEPACRRLPLQNPHAVSILKDAERARSLVLEKETETAELCTSFHEQIAFLQHRVEEKETETAELCKHFHEQIAFLQHRVEEAESSTRQAETILQSLYSSTSWRLTRPLRGLGNWIYGWRSKRLSIIYFLLQRIPGLAIWLKWVKKFPRLEARLRRIAALVLHGSLDRFSPPPVPMDAAHLSPKAKKNYRDLKNALSRREE